METKRCSRGEQCVHPDGSMLPFSEFHRCKTNRDGLHRACKACRIQEAKRRWAESGEEIKRKRQTVREDPAQLEAERRYKREWFRARYRANSEFRQKVNRVSATQKARRRQVDPEWRDRENAGSRRYYQENKQRIHAHMLHRYHTDPKYKAKVRAYEHRRRKWRGKDGNNFNASDVLRLYEAQKARCYYCGKSIKDGYHIDHVLPRDRGGSNAPGNIVLACAFCNLSKHNKTLEEWGWYTSCPLPT